MAEMLEESTNLESTTVDINRTSATVKGGRRMSFSALVVVGDRRGSVGIGYGKAPGVPAAIEKAQKDARKRLQKVRVRGGTIPHPVLGEFGTSQVRLIPAAPGTGISASGTVRAVLEMAGVHDCLTKAYGSRNQVNVCKAVIAGLLSLRTREEVAELRGVTIDRTAVDEKIEKGERFMPKSIPGAQKAEAPKNTVGQGRGRGPGGGRGRGGGGRGGNFGGGGRGPAPVAATPAPATSAADQSATPAVSSPNQAVTSDATVEQPKT